MHWLIALLLAVLGAGGGQLVARSSQEGTGMEAAGVGPARMAGFTRSSGDGTGTDAVGDGTGTRAVGDGTGER